MVFLNEAVAGVAELDPARQLLQRLVAETGADLANLSRGAKKNHAYLQQYLKRGTPRELPEDVREYLARHFSINADNFRLRPRDGDHSNLTAIAKIGPTADHHSVTNGFEETRPASNADMSRIVPGAELRGRRDVPVYASAQGGDDGMVISNDPIDWVVRPDALLHAKDGFGVYCIGDSMSPAIEQGFLVVVHPGLPPARDDYVLLTATREIGNETAALVKRLVKIEPQHWVVRQYNPSREFRLARKEWQAIFKVIAIYPRK